MKSKPETKNLNVQINPNGSVNIFEGRKVAALIAPEIFTEGWAKQSLAARPLGLQGIVPLAGQGRVGLQTTAKLVYKGLRLRFTLIPLEKVKVIHLRLVISLPYKNWEKSPYQLGRKTGKVPVNPPVHIRIAEAQSTPLSLGPSPVNKGLSFRLKAPRLYTVLQDNRQWSPYLQAFMNRHEPVEPAWEWKKGRKKVFEFTLFFPMPILKNPKKR